MSGLKYTVKFADGSERTGRLDGNGYAHLESVPEQGQHTVIYENEGEDTPPYTLQDLEQSIKQYLGS